jgi:nucleoid DNA-binding protein
MTAEKQAILTKDDIISAAARNVGTTKAAAESLFNDVLAQVRAALLEGKSVRLSGIGSLTTKTASARVCRNVKSGGTINIPERRVIKFSVASELKATVAQSQ